MDIIKLTGMKFHALHGALPAEGVVGNQFEVNITIGTDVTAAAQNDDLNATINYADVYETVKLEMKKPAKLIENVAYRIKKALTEQYAGKIKTLEVEVVKMRPPVSGEVAQASITMSYTSTP